MPQASETGPSAVPSPRSRPSCASNWLAIRPNPQIRIRQRNSVAGGWSQGVGVMLRASSSAGLVKAGPRFGLDDEQTTRPFFHQLGILTRRTDRIEVVNPDKAGFPPGGRSGDSFRRERLSRPALTACTRFCL